jgi:predicted unusual protein kinase regulating ubiquinone biosynthesis (AarF/ABC1/UbiB family)
MNDRMLQPRKGQAGEFARLGVIALEELGHTFVKSGQMLSVRSDVFSDELVSELAKLRDAATTFPAEAARWGLRRCF